MPSEKTLKRIVIILGVLLVVGFAAIVGTIIYRVINPKDAEVPPDVYETVSSSSVSFPTPEGAELIGISHNMAVTIVHIKINKGSSKNWPMTAELENFLENWF